MTKERLMDKSKFDETVKWLRNRIVEQALQIARCDDGWYLEENVSTGHQHQVTFCKSDKDRYVYIFQLKLLSYSSELLHFLSSVNTDE